LLLIILKQCKTELISTCNFQPGTSSHSEIKHASVQPKNETDSFRFCCHIFCLGKKDEQTGVASAAVRHPMFTHSAVTHYRNNVTNKWQLV